MDAIVVALAGNPNVGKSTVFNALTGSRQPVGNWPGKTVERKAGTLTVDRTAVTLVDLPGTYSLSAYSPEEEIARDFIVREAPSAIVNVVDAANLERNLYLTTQILETDVPLIIALNMADVAAARGLRIDTRRLGELLGGVPVIPMAASSGRGLAELRQAIGARVGAPRRAPARATAVELAR